MSWTHEFRCVCIAFHGPINNKTNWPGTWGVDGQSTVTAEDKNNNNIKVNCPNLIRMEIEKEPGVDSIQWGSVCSLLPLW